MLKRYTNFLGVAVAFLFLTRGVGIAADPIKLGVAGPFSGDLASYGLPALRAAELVAEDANAKGGILGRSVELLVEDDLCAPDVAATAAAKLVRENVDLVLGHICSGATKAAVEIYKTAHIITLSPSATYPALTQSGRYPNFFRTAASAEAEMRCAVDFALNTLKFIKIAVLYDSGAYGRGQAEYARGFLAKDKRAQILLDEGITPGAVDYSEVVQEINRKGAEAVIFSGYPPEASKIVVQMRKEQMETVFIADDGVKEDIFSKVIGKYTEGVYVTGPKDVSQNPMAPAAFETYRRKFGTEPGLFYLNAYAAALALLNAVDKSRSTDYDLLKEALYVETVDTPLGKIRFDRNGDVVGAGFSIYRVQDGAFVELR